MFNDIVYYFILFVRYCYDIVSSFKNDNVKFINVVKIMRKITGKIDLINVFFIVE